MENILKKIINRKKEKIIEYKKNYSTEQIFENIKNFKSYIDFKAKLKERDITGELSIIAEIKKASPSAGILRNNFNHIDIAKSYIENGAPFLSILTEEDFFLGKLDHINDISSSSKELWCRLYFNHFICC